MAGPPSPPLQMSSKVLPLWWMSFWDFWLWGVSAVESLCWWFFVALFLKEPDGMFGPDIMSWALKEPSYVSGVCLPGECAFLLLSCASLFL